VPDPKLAVEVLFGPAVAVFLLISAVAHFSLATFGYNWYVKNLKKGMNPARFYEYALSSSLMIVLIGCCGRVGSGRDHRHLWHQRHDEPVRHHDGAAQPDNEKDRLTSFIYGCIAGIVPWVVIMWHFLAALSSGDAKPPAFVYAIIPRSCVLNIFALNMFLQYKKVGRWKITCSASGCISSSAWRQDRIGLDDLCRDTGPGLESSPEFRAPRRCYLARGTSQHSDQSRQKGARKWQSRS